MSLFFYLMKQSKSTEYQNTLKLFTAASQHLDPTSDQFLAVYCVQQCYLVDVLLDDGDGAQDQTQLLRQYGWKLWDYFVKTSVSQVYRIKDSIPEVFSQEDLVSLFSEMKHQLFLELISLVEDDINEYRDTKLQKDEFYQMTHDPLHPRYFIPRDIEYIDNITKTWLYHDMLLDRFFTNSWGRASLEIFIRDVFEYWSFFLALEETKVKIIHTTIVTREDRLHLYLLIERYVIFSGEYDDIKDWSYQHWSPTIGVCFDYAFKALKMESLGGDTKKHKTQAVHTILQWAVHLYEYGMVDWRDWLLEFAVICLWWFECTSKTIRVHDMVASQITTSWEYNHQCAWLWQMMIYNRPMLRETWFYGSYPDRFTVQEYRYWNRMIQSLEATDFEEARFRHTKLSERHSEFFRCEYHRYILEFWKHYEQYWQAFDAGNKPRAIKCFAKCKDTLHRHRAFVVDQYPVDQITKNLETLEHVDFMILAAQHQIDGTVFDEAAYFATKQQASIKRQTPKTGPNDPCMCGSGIKYKKCCGNPVK